MTVPAGGRKPRWLEQHIRCGREVRAVEELIDEEHLNTVCAGAKCPNRGECYSHGTATFMIMGDTCTRGCAFCAVNSGEPRPLREEEPEAVARAAARLGLSHVVITSVTRDDLADGGAEHFVRTIEETRRHLPGSTVEVLVPDFKGNGQAAEAVLAAEPDVLNHNVETIRRLYERVRPGGDYRRSIGLLGRASSAGLLVKSGFMVGLGETPGEIQELLGDLAVAGCRVVTAGQYLAPTPESLPVRCYYTPGEFSRIEDWARGLGMEAACGPLVRSSYRAGELYEKVRGGGAAGTVREPREMARR